MVSRPIKPPGKRANRHSSRLKPCETTSHKMTPPECSYAQSSLFKILLHHHRKKVCYKWQWMYYHSPQLFCQVIADQAETFSVIGCLRHHLFSRLQISFSFQPKKTPQLLTSKWGVCTQSQKKSILNIHFTVDKSPSSSFPILCAASWHSG